MNARDLNTVGDEVAGAVAARTALGLRRIAAQQLVHGLRGDVEGSAFAFAAAAAALAPRVGVAPAALLVAAGDATIAHAARLLCLYVPDTDATLSWIDRERVTMAVGENPHQRLRCCALDVLECALVGDVTGAVGAYTAGAGIFADAVCETPTLLVAAGDAVFMHMLDLLTHIGDCDALVERLGDEILSLAWIDDVD